MMQKRCQSEQSNLSLNLKYSQLKIQTMERNGIKQFVTGLHRVDIPTNLTHYNFSVTDISFFNHAFSIDIPADNVQ